LSKAGLLNVVCLGSDENNDKFVKALPSVERKTKYRTCCLHLLLEWRRQSTNGWKLR